MGPENAINICAMGKYTTGTPLQMTSASEECPLKPRVSRATEKLAFDVGWGRSMMEIVNGARATMYLALEMLLISGYKSQL